MNRYLKFKISLLLGKLVTALLKLRGGRGTALPGLIVEKFAPEFLTFIRANIDTVILVTGTNGKTSTQTLISNMLAELTGEEVLVNSRGANLKRGLISEAVKRIRIFGKSHYKFAVLEIEEATLPKVIMDLKPNFLVVTNFFRDQLDAYGEIERTKKHIANAINQVPDMKLIGNGNDPHVVEVVTNSVNTKKFISISGFENYLSYENIDHTVTQPDPALIQIFPEPTLLPDFTSQFNISGQEFHLLLPGFHSYYAFAFSYVMLAEIFGIENLDKKAAAISLQKIAPAFGRGETITYTKSGKSTNFQIFLVKNPVGFDLTLELLATAKDELNLIILINDRIADGRDVSWLWDSRLEKLEQIKISAINLAGMRRQDMALRIKYAVNAQLYTKVRIYADYKSLLNEVHSTEMRDVKVIATYTAMNEFRDFLLNS